jgi:hypothetical protein
LRKEHLELVDELNTVQAEIEAEHLRHQVDAAKKQLEKERHG